jgi:antitoxin component YwqK of YwqJK toxin-antitoxin module
MSTAKLKICILFTVTFLFFIVNALAQDVQERWENDSLKYRGTVEDGQRDGLWEEWYSNGNLKSKLNYTNGVANGKWSFYCSHGVLEREAYWENGTCYKIATSYFSGEPYVFLDFEEGISPAEYFKFYDIFMWSKTNQLRLFEVIEQQDSFFHYKFTPILFNSYERRDFLSSDLKFYTDSIQIIEEMRNGYLEKFARSLNKKFYYTEGVDSNFPMKIITNFDDGSVWRIENTYYRFEPHHLYEQKNYLNDLLIYKIHYFSDKKEDNIYTEYYSDEKVESEGKCIEDRYDGVRKKYSPNGELTRKEYYENDSLLKVKEF